MPRKQRKGVNDDLLEPFRKAAREVAAKAKAGDDVDILVKGPLILDQGVAETAPLTLGALIVERIQQEMQDTTFDVQPQTRERRRRSQRTPQQGRYVAGLPPRPEGKYGDDSTLLRVALMNNIREGKKDVFAGIPKSRQKAAFIIRRIAPTASRELPQAVARTTTELVKTIVRKTIAKAVRKELRGTGARISFGK